MHFLSKLRLPFRDDVVFGFTALMVILVTLGFSSLLTEGFESVKLALWLVGSAGLLISAVALRYVRLAVQPVLWFLLFGFVTWFGLSSLLGVDVVQSVFGGAGRYSISFIATALWVLYIVLASGSWAGRSDKQGFMLKLLAWLGAIVAVFSILQQFGIGYYPGASASFHFIVPGFLGNQNFTGMFLVGVLPLLWWLWSSTVGWSKVVYGVLQTLVLWELALTSSRGALVALLFAFIGWLVVLVIKRQWRTLLSLLLPSLLVAVFVTSQFSPLLRQVGVATNLKANLNSATVDNRKAIWLDSLAIIERHPWLGLGAGNVLTVPQPLVFLSNVTVERFDDVHNIVLNLGLAGGLPLVILFLSFIGCLLFLAVKHAWQNSDMATWYVILGLLSLLLAALFNPLVLPCWLLLGVLVAWLIARISLVDVCAPRWYLRGLLYLLVLLFLLYAFCFIGSTWLAVRADVDYKNQTYQTSLAKARRAVVLLPWNTAAHHTIVMSERQLGLPVPAVARSVAALARWHAQFPGQMQERAVQYLALYQQSGDRHYFMAMNQALDELHLVEPYSGFSYSFAANLYLQTGQLDLAFIAATRYVTTPQRRNPYSWVLLAQVQLLRGQRDAALVSLAEAYKSNSNPTAFRAQIGSLLKSRLVDVSSLPFVFATE